MSGCLLIGRTGKLRKCTYISLREIKRILQQDREPQNAQRHGYRKKATAGFEMGEDDGLKMFCNNLNDSAGKEWSYSSTDSNAESNSVTPSYPDNGISIELLQGYLPLPEFFSRAGKKCLAEAQNVSYYFRHGKFNRYEPVSPYLHPQLIQDASVDTFSRRLDIFILLEDG